MAIITLLFGGVLGTIAALAGWLAFGLSLSMALALYAGLALGLPCLVIVASVLRSTGAAPVQQRELSRS